MRILHTMLRVGDLQRAIDFYTQVLGMKLLRTSENPEYKYSLAFVGYGPESEGAVLELTHNWDTAAYDLGNAYGHVALAVGGDDDKDLARRRDIGDIDFVHVGDPAHQAARGGEALHLDRDPLRIARLRAVEDE